MSQSNNVRYQSILRAALATPWAILPEKGLQIAAFLALKAAGGEVSAEQRAVYAAANADRPAGGSAGGVAIINVYGVIGQHTAQVEESSTGGGVSTERLSQSIRQAIADPQVAAIVLNIDSPGGGVFGVSELANEILSARKEKPIVAVANSLAASAAYWIGTAASEIVVTPGGQVGSIGVWGGHENIQKALEMEGIDVTLISAGKYKVEGNPYEPLSDEAKAAMQAQVNTYYDMFVGAVARGRGVSPTTVRNGFGEGRVVTAQEALKAGMVDRIATLEETIARLQSANIRTSLVRKSAAAELDHVIELNSLDLSPETVARLHDEWDSLHAGLVDHDAIRVLDPAGPSDFGAGETTPAPDHEAEEVEYRRRRARAASH